MRSVRKVATGLAVCLAVTTAVAVFGPSASADVAVDRPDSIERVGVDHEMVAKDLPPYVRSEKPQSPLEPSPPRLPVPPGDAAPVVSIGGDGPAPNAGGPNAAQLVSTQGLADTGWYPPDPQLGVGPVNMVEMVNGGGMIANKIGNQTSTFALNAFFGQPAIPMTAPAWIDPRVFYDDIHDRFFALVVVYDSCSCGSAGNSDLRLAVSNTSDANGGWRVYSIRTTTNQMFLDHPKLGVSDDKVIISTNDFDLANNWAYSGAGYFVVQKSDLLNNLNPLVAVWNRVSTYYNIIPARSLSSTTSHYMASTYGSVMRVWTVTGTPGNNIGSTLTTLPMAPVNSTPGAVQPNTGTTLEPGNSTAESVIWRGNSLWTVGANGCTPVGDVVQRACLRFNRINTLGTPAMALDTNVGSNGQYLIYPSLTVTPAGDLYSAFTTTSSTRFPTASLMYAQGATLATTPTIHYYAAGVNFYDLFQSRNRWGDYSDIAIDPSNTDDVWAVSEFGSTSTTDSRKWATQLGWFTAAAPRVTSVSPASGPTGGGTWVDITGHDFVAGQTSVSFGGTASSSVLWTNPNLIRALSPARPAGTVDVRVTTPLGTSPVTSADQFTYVAPPNAPSITSLSPASGPTYGGTSVTIDGSAFTGATSVTFGGTPAASFTVNNDSRITATAPSRPAGAVHVQVTTANGTSPTHSGTVYTYGAPPQVTSVMPPAGPTTGGIQVTINGGGFTGATVVLFGSAPASFTVVSATQIVATSPAVPVTAAGLVDVRVSTPGGLSPVGNGSKYLYV